MEFLLYPISENVNTYITKDSESDIEGRDVLNYIGGLKWLQIHCYGSRLCNTLFTESYSDSPKARAILIYPDVFTHL